MRHHMRFIDKGFFGAALLASLAACGGGSFNSGSGSSGGGVSAGTAKVELGSGSDTSFQDAVLAIQTKGTLSAGGSTQVTATVVDANKSNALYTQPVTVSFTSNCVSAGTATITQSVTTSTGTAIATYKAQGCQGADPITASVTVGSATLTATGSITVAAATLGTLVFVSATPSVISVKGAGGVANSTVTFQVNDANGNPASGVTVDFGLSTTQGGITFSPTSQVTGSDGKASTVITAGTVHTTVSVTGTIPSKGITQTAQNAVSISTGVPVQSRFSLAIKTHNLQSYDHDGIKDEVDVHVGDVFGSPVAVGTVVSFYANSGIISGSCPAGTPPTTSCGSCQTDATGFCSVTWTSAGNRPLNDPTDVAGHAHILAFIAGEENFSDKNDNGAFDDGDTYTECINAVLPGHTSCGNTAFKGDSFFDGTTESGFHAPEYDDIGDPYMDSSESGIYVSPEPFADIDSSVTTRRQPDGKWYGPGCGDAFGSKTKSSVAALDSSGHAETITCANKLTMIGKDDCIIMSTDHAVIVSPGTTTISDTTDLNHGANTVVLTYTVTDGHSNAIGSGSQVSVQTNSLQGVTVVISPSDPGSTSTFTEGDEGCLPPGSSPNMVQTYTITVAQAPSATQFGGSFWLQYVSADGTASDATPAITITP